MVRVLFYTGLAVLAVSFALLYLPTYFSFILAAVFAAALLVCIILRRKINFSGIKTMLSVLLIFTLFGIYTNYSAVLPAQNLASCTAQITGTVTERPNRYNTYSVYIIKTSKILVDCEKYGLNYNDIPQEITVRVSDVNSIDLNIFETVTLNVTFNELGQYRASNLANKIYASGEAEALVEKVGVNRPFYAIFYDLRDSINNLIFKNINYDEASLISAVLIGERNFLDPVFESNAKAVGITHVLVVSGGHLGIIFQLLSGIFTLFRINRRTGNIIMLFSIFALEAICGFSPSILRAGLTYVILVIGRLIYRSPDPLNSLGLATIIILFTNPFGFGNLALLLSLASTFGIIYLCPIIYSFFEKLVSKLFTPKLVTKGILLTLAQTLSATIATTPICIIGIGYISLMAPISNLLITGAINILTSLAFITVILLCLPSFLKAAAALPVIVLCLLVRYIVFITNLLAKAEWAIIPTEGKYIITLVLGLLIIPVALAFRKYRKIRKANITLKTVACLLAVTSFASIFVLYNSFPSSNIDLVNVGKGSCVIITHGNIAVAVGAGDSPSDYRKIESYLFSAGRRYLNHLILPAANRTYAGGAPELIFYQNCEVTYPAEGDYSDRLNFISNDRFHPFSGTTTFNEGGIEIVTVANLGCAINVKEYSAIIYTGTGNILELLKYCNNKKPKVISSTKLELPLEFETNGIFVTQN